MRVRSLGRTSGISRVWLADLPQAWLKARSGIRVTCTLLPPPPPPLAAYQVAGCWSDHHHHRPRTRAEAHSQREWWMLRVKRAGAPQAETFNRDTSSANRMAATQCIQACGVQFVYVCASLSLGSSLSTALAFYCSVCVKDERSTKDDGRAEPQLRLFPLPSARLHCSEKTKTKKQQDLLFETIVYSLALRYCFEVCF